MGNPLFLPHRGGLVGGIFHPHPEKRSRAPDCSHPGGEFQPPPGQSPAPLPDFSQHPSIPGSFQIPDRLLAFQRRDRNDHQHGGHLRGGDQHSPGSPDRVDPGSSVYRHSFLRYSSDAWPAGWERNDPFFWDWPSIQGFRSEGISSRRPSISGSWRCWWVLSRVEPRRSAGRSSAP